MTEQAKVLIEFTRDFLYEKKDVTLAPDLNFQAILDFSVAHNLQGVLYSVISNALNADIVPTQVVLNASGYFYDGIFIYEQQKRTIEKVFDTFSSNGIRHLFFKGAIIKEIYPIPECRLMGDIDVLIAEKDRTQAKQALMHAGFTCTAGGSNVMEFRKGDIELEVHTALTGSQEEYEPAFDDAMETAQYEHYCGKPDDNLHLAYLIAHTAHHFLFYGAGIRMILDIAVMLKKCDIDIDSVLKRCRAINLEKFAKIILSICYKWYGVGQDFSLADSNTENFLTMYGVFGNIERNKSVVLARRYLEQSNSHDVLGAKWSLLFPSYKHLCNMPYITFIKGRPWLTPVAWCYRFFYNVVGRRAFVKKSISGIDAHAMEQAQKELDLFRGMGLK